MVVLVQGVKHTVVLANSLVCGVVSPLGALPPPQAASEPPSKAAIRLLMSVLFKFVSISR